MRKLVDTDFYIGGSTKDAKSIFYLKQSFHFNDDEKAKGHISDKGLIRYKDNQYKLLIWNPSSSKLAFLGYHVHEGCVTQGNSLIATINIQPSCDYSGKDTICSSITLENNDKITVHKECEDWDNNTYLIKYNKTLILKTLVNASEIEGVKSIWTGYQKVAQFINHKTFEGLSVEAQVCTLGILGVWPNYCSRFEDDGFLGN